MKNHILPVLRHKLVADITVQDICEVLDPLWEKKTTIASRIRGPATWKGNLEAYFPPPARVHRREHQKAYTIEALADQLKGVFVSTGPCTMLSSSASSPPRDKLSSMTQNGPRSTLSIRSGLFRPNEGKTASPSHSASHCLTRRSRCPSALRQRASTSFRAATTTIAQWLATMSRQWWRTQYASGGTATMHGCRSTFRDWCAREGVDTAVAEKCLMHSLKSVQAAYQRDDLLERRRPVMQAWADTIMPKK